MLTTTQRLFRTSCTQPFGPHFVRSKVQSCTFSYRQIYSVEAITKFTYEPFMKVLLRNIMILGAGGGDFDAAE